MKIDISPIHNFLGCESPLAWCEAAAADQATLLLDHAHCEKKAASNAIALMFRYPEHLAMVEKLSRLAREELRHFEQVISLLKKRHIEFKHLTPSRYADGMRKLVATHEPQRLIDILVMSAFIEARSCERFSKIIPFLDDELAAFYSGLLASEARHFQTFLGFARSIANDDLENKISVFRAKEMELIQSADTVLRFHSGIPAVSERRAELLT